MKAAACFGTTLRCIKACRLTGSEERRQELVRWREQLKRLGEAVSARAMGRNQKAISDSQKLQKARNTHDTTGKRAGSCSPGAEVTSLCGLIVLLQLSSFASAGWGGYCGNGLVCLMWCQALSCSGGCRKMHLHLPRERRAMAVLMSDKCPLGS